MKVLFLPPSSEVKAVFCHLSIGAAFKVENSSDRYLKTNQTRALCYEDGRVPREVSFDSVKSVTPLPDTEIRFYG